MHLQGLDLNLLIALDALLSERNVTRAAERMHISQPGMSAALQKLRWHFEDELLERIGRRLELTPRARQLVDPVRDILTRVRALSDAEEQFDPSGADRLFRLAGSSLCSGLLALPLAQRLIREAPGIRFQFEDLSEATLQRLSEGGIDFAIVVSQLLTLDPAGLDKTFSETPLFNDRFVLVVAADNDQVGETLTYQQFCAIPYVGVQFGIQTASIAEKILRHQADHPTVKFWLPSFHEAFRVVAGTGLATIAPRMLAKRYARTLNLRIIDPPPLDLPILAEQLCWHPRNDPDPGHRWFRDIVLEVTQQVMAETGNDA